MDLIYKYYGFGTGLTALKYRTLGFNTPDQFNDPMEGRYWLHAMGVEANFLDRCLENIGVLCMTTDPLNPLMWSHYAESHAGFVIGYDVNEPILGEQKDCVFGVDDGQVFYSSKFEVANASAKAREALTWLQMGMDLPETEERKQILRHILLMKQDFWHYERETRIVKILSNYSEEQRDWENETGNRFRTLSTPAAPMLSLSNSGLRLLPVADGSIKRVLLGVKNPLLQADTEVSHDPDLMDVVKTPGLQIERTKWSRDGRGMDAVEASVGNWGPLKEIRTKKLEHRELEVVSRKLAVADSEKQDLTLTTFPDGRIEALWDSELL